MWELYDTTADRSQARDLAAEHAGLPEQGNASTGEVARVQLDVGDAAADVDHRISAESV
jgi:hypothetical protein